jgi:hypothetical protein
MITAEATHYPNYMHVVFRYPDCKPKEIDLQGDNPVILEGRAIKMLYNESRAYIIRKLTAWLNQRMFIFKEYNRPTAYRDAARMLVLLGVFENGGYFQLCDRLTDNREIIESLAPSEKSGHYEYYINKILPILVFCQKVKEGLI